MEKIKMNLKKSFFGYKKESVLSYLSEVEKAYAEKVEENRLAEKSLMKAQERLKKELEDVSKKHENTEKALEDACAKADEWAKKAEILSQENSKLREENQALKKSVEDKVGRVEEFSCDSDDDNCAAVDIISEAKRFADELKRNAELEYAQNCANNLSEINFQKRRVTEYVRQIDNLCKNVENICREFSREISSSSARLKELSMSDYSESVLENSGSYVANNCTEPKTDERISVKERIKRLGIV